MDAFASALAAAITTAPAPLATSADSAPHISIAITAPRPGATNEEKATLAGLSLVDFVQTRMWLDERFTPSGRPTHENDPLLGKHPTMLRMALTGVALDSALLGIRSPVIRRFSIGLEAGNVLRNFAIGMKI